MDDVVNILLDDILIFFGKMRLTISENCVANLEGSHTICQVPKVCLLVGRCVVTCCFGCMNYC